MKNIIKLLVLPIVVFQINSVLADEDLPGTWQGKLVVGPNNELTIQFIIDQISDGSYSVVLNSPDQDAVKNVKADSVSYSSDVLKVNVAELSGSYEGVFEDGKIDGNWKQGGTTFPLIMRPYEKPTLSEKDKEILLGTWQGKPVPPEGAIVAYKAPTFVFRFEMNKKGEFTGIMTMPDIGGPNMPVTDMGISDGIFTFNVSGMQVEFKGKLTDKEFVGELRHTAYPNAPVESITLKKEDL